MVDRYISTKESALCSETTTYNDYKMTPEWDALSALHKIKAEDQYQVVRDIAKKSSGKHCALTFQERFRV